MRRTYYFTVLVATLAGGVIGSLIGALFGYVGNEVGWWGVGMLLGLFYGVIAGFSLAEPS